MLRKRKLYLGPFHSNQGWDYQMKAYSQKLKELKIFQSMSRKGHCLDNSIIEKLFSLLKQEVYHGTYRSFDELKVAIKACTEYYNTEHMKKKLNWLNPIQFRKATQIAA